MTTSELLNTLVTEMAAKKGYAYTAGYLQSQLMQALSYSTMTNREKEANKADLEYTLAKLRAESV